MNAQAPGPSQPFEILRDCPGCGGTAILMHAAPSLCRCACGLFFENPRPWSADILDYYDRGVTYGRFAPQQRARDLLWAKRLRLVLRFRGSGRLLDVGTGDGHFLEYARRHFAAEGTELSRAGVRLALDRQVTVWNGTLEELPLQAGAYDVVTLWHVLEHLPYPAADLARIRRLLAPGGHLVVAVPNEARLLDLQRLLRRRHNPFRPCRPGDEIHLTHFTPTTLAALLRRRGFRVLRMGADDADADRTWRSRARELAHRLSGALVGRRWCSAMYAICQGTE